MILFPKREGTQYLIRALKCSLIFMLLIVKYRTARQGWKLKLFPLWRINNESISGGTMDFFLSYWFFFIFSILTFTGASLNISRCQKTLEKNQDLWIIMCALQERCESSLYLQSYKMLLFYFTIRAHTVSITCLVVSVLFLWI